VAVTIFTPDQQMIMINNLGPKPAETIKAVLNQYKTQKQPKATTKAASQKWTAADYEEAISHLLPDEQATLNAMLQANNPRLANTLLQAAKKGIPPGLEIPRTAYPKWWKDSSVALIGLINVASQQVIRPTPGSNVYVACISFTVSGETNVTFGFGDIQMSGPMDFGGDSEPRGIVMAMGESPAPCAQAGFTIYSSEPTVWVGGFTTYYLEKIEVPKP
jgi:hypothetical protein